MKRLGLGVSKIDLTTTFDFVVTLNQVWGGVPPLYPKREARAVPSAFGALGEGAAFYQATGISAATGRNSSRETVGSCSPDD